MHGLPREPGYGTKILRLGGWVIALALALFMGWYFLVRDEDETTDPPVSQVTEVAVQPDPTDPPPDDDPTPTRKPRSPTPTDVREDCHQIPGPKGEKDGYIFDGMTEIEDQQGGLLEVEYWTKGGNGRDDSPERLVILVPGRYEVIQDEGQVNGKIREWVDCSDEEVNEITEAEIRKRQADGANNDGWGDSHLFKKL